MNDLMDDDQIQDLLVRLTVAGWINASYSPQTWVVLKGKYKGKIYSFGATKIWKAIARSARIKV